ncbi:MAG: hypothetical protein AABY10_00920, partial [Nanoarchaeota archaeon]
GSNNTGINLTAISIKMLPWTSASGSFVPPRSGDDGTINISSPDQFNKSYPGCLAYYNISLLNNTGYMLEMYAKNSSNEAGNPGNANNLAGFKNLTSLDGLQVNITLYKLVGNYFAGSVSGLPVNTSAMKINIVNSTGGPITTQVSANVKVKNTNAGIGTVYYMIDSSSITNGTFYLPVLNNSNYAKVMVFSNNGPPKETSINLSAAETNVTVKSMNGNDKGFRNLQSNGSLDVLNATSTSIKLRFLSASQTGCDVPNIPDNSSCVITTMDANNFNPLKAMLAGKVNMEIKIASTNTSLIFHNYDMMSAKQPPMDSIMDENASSRKTSSGLASVQDQWNFGSFAPPDSYSNVTITMPYSDTSSSTNYINDSKEINVSLGALYDENNRVVWNVTRGDTSSNLTDEFIDYNNTFYNGLLLTGGVVCGNYTNQTCFVNTSANYISMKVPHFSTVGAVVLGASTLSSSTTASTTTSTGGSSSGSSVVSAFWKNTYSYDTKELMESLPLSRELKKASRIKVKISNEAHYVGIASINQMQVTINVSSKPQEATLILGEEKKFEVNEDDYYDLKVKLNSIQNGSANITITGIHEQRVGQNEVKDETSTTLTGDSVSMGEEEKVANSPLSDRKSWIVVLTSVILIVILLIIFIWVFIAKKNKNRYGKKGFYSFVFF